MNRQLLINRLRAHIAWQFDGTFDACVVCSCGWVSGNREDDRAVQWARHVASVIYPETAGADRTIAS